MAHQANSIVTGAEDVCWDLTDLYPGPAELEKDIERAEREADEFSSRYRDRVHALTAEELRDSLLEYQALSDRLDRTYTYAFLNWSGNTEDAQRGALLQKVREKYSWIGQKILFFELELTLTEPERMTGLLGDENLSDFSHFLETLSLRREHVLTEAEEKILSEKAVTGPGAWSRFFDETLGSARFELNGEELTEQEILSRLYQVERTTRREAALAFTEGLRRHLRSLTFAFNTLLAEKASDDRLRKYPHWLKSRNLSNEISDEAVAALVDAVTSHYGLVSRYYALKRKLLKLDELFDYDRYAPIGAVETRYSWDEARELVLESYQRFHPRMSDIAGRFFEDRWIDAAMRPGKRGGAFSHRGVPDVHPYILMNFTGNMRDVQTLAHELGHGVHQYLARERGSLQASTPLTTSETASVFGEMLVFERMLDTEGDREQRLAMVVSKIDDTIATVFRQITMNRFEDRIHTARRQEGELSSERLSEFWIETQSHMFQNSVTLGDHYRLWWSYIPHFIHTPGYVYAYAFGELLVLALYAIYKEEGSGFAERYLRLLAAGGSDWPHVLVGELGVDLQDPHFWVHGLEEIEKLIEEAERLAAEAL